MGNWHISVEGVGTHHNKDYPQDADQMAKKFVDDLKSAGHVITAAYFTYGGRVDLDARQGQADILLSLVNNPTLLVDSIAAQTHIESWRVKQVIARLRESVGIPDNEESLT